MLTTSYPRHGDDYLPSRRLRRELSRTVWVQ